MIDVMIGVPMPDPRDSLITNLNQQLDQYFGAGNNVQEIPPGVSGKKDGTFGSSHSNRLRAERDKIAPRLKELAEAGSFLNNAAEAAGIDYKRTFLIARENNIKFPGA